MKHIYFVVSTLCKHVNKSLKIEYYSLTLRYRDYSSNIVVYYVYDKILRVHIVKSINIIEQLSWQIIFVVDSFAYR